MPGCRAGSRVQKGTGCAQRELTQLEMVKEMFCWGRKRCPRLGAGQLLSPGGCRAGTECGQLVGALPPSTALLCSGWFWPVPVNHLESHH